jgi:hypothetical protein
MARSRGLTWQEKHAHVLAYLDRGYGQKGDYLREHGLSAGEIRTWRSQVYIGTLEQGLVPRERVKNNIVENREIGRLAEANEEFQAFFAQQEELHREELAAKDAELAHQRAAVEALGKAIALLHQSNDSAAGTTGQ